MLSKYNEEGAHADRGAMAKDGAIVRVKLS